jgi:hypothetical protein
MAGYRVIEAATCAEMVQQIEGETVNLLVAGFDLLAVDPPALERLRHASDSTEMRVIGLVNSLSEIEQRRALYPEFDDYQVRYESEAMLRSVERLSQSLDRRSTARLSTELRGL